MFETAIKRCIPIFFVTLILFLGFFSSRGVLAAEPTRRTVRVGYFSFPGYQDMDAQGNRSGYGYEYLQRMLDYANWDYQYVGYEEGKSWNDMLAMLKDGQIDLLTSATKTESRLADYDFSDEPMGNSSTILTVKAGSTTYKTGDFANWNGMRVGLLNGNSRNDSFADYAAQNGFSYNPVYYDSEDTLKTALANGDIDAIVTSDLRQIKNEWLLAKFDTKPFYAIVRKGDSGLLAEVNTALSQLKTADPGLSDTLYQKYYAPDNGNQINFTAEERAYIAQCQKENKVFSAIIDPDMSPLSYGENGAAKGIFTDICQEIFKRTGLTVSIKAPATRTAYLTARDAADTDICCDLPDDYANSEAKGYIQTDAYYQSSVARVAKKNATGSVKAVGLVRGSDVAHIVASQMGSDTAIKYYDTISACLDALRNGSIGAAYLHAQTAQAALYDDETDQLASTTMAVESVQIAMGINKKDDYLLAAIINKALLSMNDADISSIAAPYAVGNVREQTVAGFLYKNPMVVAGILGFLCIAATSAILAMVWRKRQLAEEQLNVAMKTALDAAEEANAAKSTFLSRMSHEIRTPINAITGFTELSRQELDQSSGDTAELLSYNAGTQASAQYLLAIVNDILETTKIENGKIDLMEELIEMAPFFKEITDLTRALADPKGVEFDTQIDQSLSPAYRGDRTRLKQILMNLLSNAAKFTGTGGRICFDAKEITRKEGRAALRFTVTDNGVGISPEFMEALFTPFAQEYNGATSPYGGTGLGLSISRHLARLMDGDITCESQKGKGTTFTATVVLGVAGAVPETTADPGRNYNFSGLHALSCEDNPINSRIIKKLLENKGCAVDEAENGQVGIDRFMASGVGHYDFILMDIRMPVTDGLEATRQIRAADRPDARTIPIIAMSANAFAEDVAKSREAGIDEHLSKPVDADAMYRVIQKYAHGMRHHQPMA